MIKTEYTKRLERAKKLYSDTVYLIEEAKSKKEDSWMCYITESNLTSSFILSLFLKARRFTVEDISIVVGTDICYDSIETLMGKLKSNMDGVTEGYNYFCRQLKKYNL